MCLGGFCDIMRCDVLKSSSFLDEESKSTDVSIWTPSAVGVGKQKQQQSTSSQRKSIGYHPHHRRSQSSSHKSSEEIDGGPQSQSDSVEHCDEDYFSQLRTKCSELVWNCLQGLIPVLDAKDFKVIQSNSLALMKTIL